ncbi:MAG: DUF1501 domain-containing protein [Planctomycetaceae bacterium]|nr:DUF1501 domain-containing protein [Planctomycetaceae bacterium]
MMHDAPLLPFSRREMLSRTGAGFGLLGLAGLLDQERVDAAGKTPAGRGAGSVSPLAPRAPHHTPRAKRIIFLFMNGGPSHVDTFDPKPELVKQAGKKGPGGKWLPSPFKFSPQGKSGIEVSELFPHLSTCIDDICVLRSMYTSTPNHEPGLFMMNCGIQQPLRPSMGSWLNYGLGTENQNLPGFVVLCPGKPVVGPALWSNSFLPGIFQGTHINNSKIDPKKVIGHLSNPNLGPTSQRRLLDLIQRLNGEHLQRRNRDRQLDARINSLEIAYRMQFEAQEAFDIGRETKTTREAYGSGQFADGCLIARRLVERGVRMVQLFYGSGQPWDAHGNIMDHKRDAGKSDRPIAALLKDLDSRGLLEETLVLWSGEFGRTPTAQGARGRNHHATGFSAWMAGGGIKGGMIHGATDELGMHSVEKRMSVHDLHATILHQMGIDHLKLTYRYSGRDFRLTDIHGEIAHEILA